MLRFRLPNDLVLFPLYVDKVHITSTVVHDSKTEKKKQKKKQKKKDAWIASHLSAWQLL